MRPSGLNSPADFLDHPLRLVQQVFHRFEHILFLGGVQIPETCPDGLGNEVPGEVEHLDVANQGIVGSGFIAAQFCERVEKFALRPPIHADFLDPGSDKGAAERAIRFFQWNRRGQDMA